MWGGQVERLGVGAHIRFTQLTAARLEQGMASILTPERRTRAAEFAKTLSTDDASARTADIVEATAR